MTDTPDEFIFGGYGNICRVNKKFIKNWKHIVVDIASEKIYNQDERQTSKGTFTDTSPSRKIQKIEKNDFHPNHLSSINISSVRTTHQNSNKKGAIEAMLKTKISNMKKVKNQSLDSLETVFKTQRELSDEMMFLLEELDDYCDMADVDAKKHLEYIKYIKGVYRELIANAPFVVEVPANPVIDKIDTSSNREVESQEKNGTTQKRF